MLNPRLKLNPKIFNPELEKGNLQEAFGQALVLVGQKDKNIVALTADLASSTKMNLFAQKFPERFIQVGVAEQNLVTVASGLAVNGKIPFCASYAMFSPGRNWEQIRTTITYNDQPVKIIGSHVGITVGPDGGTHQMTEDIALTRVLPNLEIFSPVDAFEVQKMVVYMSQNQKPNYLRLARGKFPLLTTLETPFEFPKAQIFWLPEIGLAQVGIIATGEMVYSALLAAKELEAEGLKTKVMNLSTLKPLDQEAIIALAKESKAIVTVEDHQIAGGMGSAVAEVLAQNYPVPIEFVGIKDRYGQSGKAEELLEYYGLSVKDIKEAVQKVLKRKTS